MARQEIYFRSYRAHSPKYPGVYPDIQAGLLRSIMRNPAARGISAIPHQTQPSRLDARTLVLALRVPLSDDVIEDGQRARRVRVGRPWR
jgi:hypothetical protein